MGKHVRGTDAQEHAEDAARMLKHQHHHEPRDEQPGQGPPPPPAAQLMQFGELVLLRERVHSGMQEKPPITSETKCVASSLNAQAVEATNSMSCQRLAGEYTDALRRVASMPQAGPGEMTGAVCAWPGLVPPPARGQAHHHHHHHVMALRSKRLASLPVKRAALCKAAPLPTPCRCTGVLATALALVLCRSRCPHVLLKQSLLL